MKISRKIDENASLAKELKNHSKYDFLLKFPLFLKQFSVQNLQYTFMQPPATNPLPGTRDHLGCLDGKCIQDSSENLLP